MNAERLRKLVEISKDLRRSLAIAAISGWYRINLQTPQESEMPLWELAAKTVGWKIEVISNETVLTPSDLKKWQQKVKVLSAFFEEADSMMVQAAAECRTYTQVGFHLDPDLEKYVRLWVSRKGLNCTFLAGAVSLCWALP